MTSNPPPSALVAPTHTPQRHAGSVEENIESSTWYDFATLILFLVGVLNVLNGISAVADSKYVKDSQLFGSLHAWGWFFLIWGIIQLVAAFAVYRGETWGVVIALATVFFNAVAQLSHARSYPVWSISIFVLDVLVMYGLVVHRPPQRFES